MCVFALSSILLTKKFRHIYVFYLRTFLLGYLRDNCIIFKACYLLLPICPASWWAGWLSHSLAWLLHSHLVSLPFFFWLDWEATKYTIVFSFQLLFILLFLFYLTFLSCFSLFCHCISSFNIVFVSIITHHTFLVLCSLEDEKCGIKGCVLKQSWNYKTNYTLHSF